MVKNDPITIAHLLRCLAGGTEAKYNKTEHIFNAAADLLDQNAVRPVADREAITNAIIDNMRTLNGLNAAMDAIMALLNPPVRDDVVPHYYVRNGYIFKRPVRTDAGVTMGFPVCLVCDGVDAEQVCAILNRGEPAFETRQATTEKEAYDSYVKRCHANPGMFVSEFNFKDWREAGRPKGPDPVDGNWLRDTE